MTFIMVPASASKKISCSASAPSRICAGALLPKRCFVSRASVEAEMVITLGAYLDEVLYTRPGAAYRVFH